MRAKTAFAYIYCYFCFKHSDCFEKTTITATISEEKDLQALTALMERLGVNFTVDEKAESIVNLSDEELSLRIRPAFEQIKVRRVLADQH